MKKFSLNHIATAILFLFLTSSNHFCFGQSSSSWKQELENELTNFIGCMTDNADNACKSVAGKSVKIVYNSDDFLNNANGQYASAYVMASKIESDGKWEKLGYAYNQETLSKSQELANNNRPVVALYKNEAGQNAHAVLILPGELKSSGSWGMSVPNAASFFSHDPQKSFVDKSMAYAFTKKMLLRVELYAKGI